MDNIFYSHRPRSGVSIAVCGHGDKLYLAAVFANDGKSRNGNFDQARFDNFERGEARRRLDGRIRKAIEGKPGCFVQVLSSTILAKEFMHSMRQLFKPDPYENDTTFCETYKLLNGEYRERMFTTKMWDRIRTMASIVIANYESTNIRL